MLDLVRSGQDLPYVLHRRRLWQRARSVQAGQREAPARGAEQRTGGNIIEEEEEKEEKEEEKEGSHHRRRRRKSSSSSSSPSPLSPPPPPSQYIAKKSGSGEEKPVYFVFHGNLDAFLSFEFVCFFYPRRL